MATLLAGFSIIQTLNVFNTVPYTDIALAVFCLFIAILVWLNPEPPQIGSPTQPVTKPGASLSVATKAKAAVAGTTDKGMPFWKRFLQGLGLVGATSLVAQPAAQQVEQLTLPRPEQMQPIVDPNQLGLPAPPKEPESPARTTLPTAATSSNRPLGQPGQSQSQTLPGPATTTLPKTASTPLGQGELPKPESSAEHTYNFLLKAKPSRANLRKMHNNISSKKGSIEQPQNIQNRLNKLAQESTVQPSRPAAFSSIGSKFVGLGMSPSQARLGY
jgi:hypothetical protein